MAVSNYLQCSISNWNNFEAVDLSGASMIQRRIKYVTTETHLPSNPKARNNRPLSNVCGYVLPQNHSLDNGMG
jgi:hypothetical protein